MGFVVLRGLSQGFGAGTWLKELLWGICLDNLPNFVRVINEFCCMGYTIAIIKRKDAKRILACRDANAVIPVEECTYDKTVLERPLDKIYAVLSETFPPLNGPEVVSDERAEECVDYSFLPNAIYVGYVGSQHWELNEILNPLLQKYDCVLYNCDWGTVSLPENSVKVSLVKCKHWLKANKWARALRDTLLVFLLGEAVLLFCFPSLSFLTDAIVAMALASSRIWAEIYLHFRSKQ